MKSGPAYNFETFKATCERAIADFENNGVIKKIAARTIQMTDYHSLLKMIYHQTLLLPPSMGLAASLCPSKHILIRDYLIRHAEEEKNHWKWAAEDLRSTAYRGPELQSTMPHPACMQFVSFGYFLALKYPVARLGLPAVLEGISAKYAAQMAQKAQGLLNITSKQLIFAYGHGEADVGHIKDIFDVLEKSELGDEDWKWLIYAADISGQYYKNMLNKAVDGTV